MAENFIITIQSLDAVVEHGDSMWSGTGPLGESLMLLPADVTALALDADWTEYLEATHPAIACLQGTYEADGHHWLVYQWEGGELLSTRLAKGYLFEPNAAVLLSQRLVEGLVYIGRQDIRHAGVRPERIGIDSNGAARLIGIGLVPPVHFEDDVLAVGELLYLLVTGKHPIRNERGEIELPSSHLPELDPELEKLILTAIGELHDSKIDDIEALHQALEEYLSGIPEDGESEDDPASLRALMRRVRKSNDFPALSRAINAIGRITDADSERLQTLSAIILRDFSLTNKVLRLANSASFGHFGGEISTISRAVIILGFNTIKSLALTLVLFEQLSNRAHAVELRDMVARAFFTSVLARRLAEKCSYRDMEEARISGMMHLLGKLLSCFYFHDESMRIVNRCQETHEDENEVARSILGASFEEFGVRVAKDWHLPDKLIASMPALDPKPRKPASDSDWLRLFANAGADLMTAMLSDEPARQRLFQETRVRYADVMGLSERDLRAVVRDAAQDCLRDAQIFGLDASQGEVLARIRALFGMPVSPTGGVRAPTPAEPPSSLAAKLAQASSQAKAVAQSLKPVEAAKPATSMDDDAEEGPPPEPIEILATGVQDITDTLVGDFNLNDLLRMILETMYRGLGFDHVLLAARDIRRNALVGRLGFGEGVERILPRFVLPLTESADVFRVALSKNADMLIDDINAASIRDRIPPWFRECGAGETFLLLPVVVDKKIAGLFYGGMRHAGQMKVGQKELSLAKTLRNQALLAIRQKQPTSSQ